MPGSALDSFALVTYFSEERGADAAALAKIKNAELVTGDPEFKIVERELKKIRWLK